MHYRVEVVISIGCGVTFNPKFILVSTVVAASLHILADGLHVIITIRPALFMKEAQTMEQFMHDGESASPARNVDVLLSPLHPDIGAITCTVLNVDIIAAAIVIVALAEV